MVWEDVGGVDVIPANVDRIGFFAVPYRMSIGLRGPVVYLRWKERLECSMI
jgi:hypothetical protein